MAVEFRLLGDVEVCLDGRVLPIGHARQQNVLVTLLIDANRPVPVDQLVERVWADRPPMHARSALSGYLSRLRGILAPADARIERRPGGYVLAVDPLTVDLHRFDQLVEEALGDVEDERAAELFATAFGLWRGEAFGGLDTPWLNAVRAALGQRRLAAELARNDLELRHGRHEEVLGDLLAGAATHPLDERLVGQLMVALYRCGRQAHALDVYHRLRVRLADELGADPSPPLRQLHESILTGDPALTIPEASEAVHAGNLPAESTSFVGRDEEIATLTRLLSSVRLVTLTGVGGVGKTRLALHAGRRSPDETWVVELAEVRDPDLVAQTVADALGIRDVSARAPLEVITKYLRDRRLLLILDNAEHLLDAAAALVSAVLHVAVGVRILVTSRQPLRIGGEHVVTVPPLPSSGAVTLFADRTRAVLPGGFAITDDNRAAVTELCRRLDGIPLAIELAAARLRTLSPDQLLARLDDRFRLLTGGYRTALPRHRTLAATVDWSFELCSPAEQRLWARVSVFTGSFGLDAAEGVCGENVLEPLDGLVDKSVLTAERQAGVVRYRLLETLRHYGRDRLREPDEAATLGRRHAAWYRGLVERGEAEWFGPDQLTWFSTMRAEHANLRSAFEFCLTTPGEAETGLGMAASLCFYWIACGFVREGRYWLDRILELATEPGPARAKALWVNGWIAITQGELADGECMLEESRCLSTRLGDETALAHARHKLGLARLFGGDLPAGVEQMEQALARLRDLGEQDSYVLMAQVQLAMTSSLRGDVGRATELARQALAVCTERGELWVRSGALYALARVEWRSGRMARATDHGCESLRLKRTLNDLVGTVLVVEQLAWIAAADGQDERAAVLLGAAHRLWPSVGQPLFGSKYHLAAHEECVEHVRETLGAQAFHDAVRRGAELTVPQAVSYALSVQGAATVLGGEQDGDRGRREEDDRVGLEQPGVPLIG